LGKCGGNTAIPLHSLLHSHALARAACLFTLLAACSTPAPSSTPSPASAATPHDEAPSPPCFVWENDAIDAETVARLDPLVRAAVVDVERFFGAAFARSFTLTVLPDRAAFSDSFPPEWGLGETQCWMVAAGVADGVRLLSPRVWKSEACEHDPADARHVRNVLAHELVHVYHAQHNPSPDFTGVAGIDWFVEGLATFASGQLEEPGLLRARDALASGAGPSTLATAWTGRYRYGVSGSLVAFLDRELGRARIVEGLAATSGEELLATLGLDETTLLERWRADVLAP
jgi:hypothetical protein